MSFELADLDADQPCGPNLEFDAAFGELERASQGRPEQQYGGTIIPAEEPNWKEVAGLASDLTDRTRDLRVLVNLAIARLHLTGLPDFIAVVVAIRDLMQTRWAFVHPQLDPEDDNDPTLRANALLRLTEPVLVLRLLRTAPLAASQRDGAVSWRTIGIFNNTVEPDEEAERKTEDVIRTAFRQTGAEVLEQRRALIEEGAAALAAISAVFDTEAGYGTGPDLTNTSKLLQEMARYIKIYMPPPDAVAGEEAPADEAASGTAYDGAAAPAATSARSSAFSIASLRSVDTRDDALKLLDLVCRYYEQHEPSSPLPLLIGRARRLADKGFLEILQDLAPDGLMQAQNVVQTRDQ